MIHTLISMIVKSRNPLIIAFLLFWLVSFLFCLPVSSQVILGERLKSIEDQLLSSSGKAEEELDFLEKPDIEYTAGDFRDPFFPQVFISKREEPKVQEEIEVIKLRPSELFSLSIQGIVWNPDNPLVIINNQVLKKGEALLIPKGRDITEEVMIMDIDRDGVSIIYLGEVERLSSPAASQLQEIIRGGKK